MSNVIQLPVIAGVEITTDEHGRFNLNALHRAHLELNPDIHRNSKQPADWLKLEGTKDLIEAISNSEDLHLCPIEAKAGRYGGTFAVEQLAVAYANWISPTFYLQVIDTFLAYKKGTLQPNPAAMSRLEILQLAMEAENENQRLTHEVQELKPKAEFHDKVVISEDAISVAEAAKIIGTGRNRLLAFLRRNKWVTRKNEPYQAKIETGYMDVKLSPFEHPTQGLQRSVTPLITGKGLAELQRIHRSTAA